MQPTSAPARSPTMTEVRLDINGQLRVETEASIWLVTADRYCRLPRLEGPRERAESLDGALDDAVWHPHVGVWYCADDRGSWLRILPAGRPVGSHGIKTGDITSSLCGFEIS